MEALFHTLKRPLQVEQLFTILVYPLLTPLMFLNLKLLQLQTERLPINLSQLNQDLLLLPIILRLIQLETLLPMLLHPPDTEVKPHTLNQVQLELLQMEELLLITQPQLQMAVFLQLLNKLSLLQMVELRLITLRQLQMEDHQNSQKPHQQHHSVEPRPM
jgi:hypothetical protein